MSKKTYGVSKFYTEDNTYYCEINYQNHKFIGSTIIHPEDEDFKYQSVGYTIAETRAEIKRLQYVKEITKAELHALEHLNATSRTFPDTNIYHRLMEQINDKKNKIKLIDECINDYHKFIYTYINEKDKMWKFIRERDKVKKG